MQFSSALVAAAAFAVVNAVSFTNPAFNGVTAGQPFTFTWIDASGPVTITLKDGPSTDLKTVSTITSGQTSGSFTWPVPSSLSSGTYAFEINDSTGKPNYSSQFELIGGAAASVSSSVSSAVSSIASSASSAISSISTSAAASSASSILSSIAGNSTTTGAPSSSTGAASTTGALNSTLLSTTPKPTSTGSSSAGATAGRTSSAATTSGTGAPNANSGAADIASPLALVFLTVAALITLN